LCDPKEGERTRHDRSSDVCSAANHVGDGYNGLELIADQPFQKRTPGCHRGKRKGCEPRVTSH
jgi:hypothetical protein